MWKKYSFSILLKRKLSRNTINKEYRFRFKKKKENRDTKKKCCGKSRAGNSLICSNQISDCE